MRRPVIGICAAVERAKWGAWEALAALSPLSYTRAIQKSAGVAVLAPPDASPEGLERFLGLVDGLLLAGGSDMDPSTYGAPVHPKTGESNLDRDRFELAAAREALQRDLPVVGICRGMEVMNVATGGTLVQHLPDVVGDDNHRRTAGVFGEHEVRLHPGSLAARAIGAERLSVKSYHHQALEQLGHGVVPTGWSVGDDVIEAIEVTGRRFALGVLWHPEEDLRDRVVRAFVHEAAMSARN